MTLATLKDLYIDELQDMYSADRQSKQATKLLLEAANDDDLKIALKKGVDGIDAGMGVLEMLIKAHGAKPNGEHCKGMEGLVAEAKAHAVDEDFADPAVRDAMIISQYQRMAHYGLAGYGCLAAFAKRLGLNAEADQLKTCLEQTRGGDETMNEIAERQVNPRAAH